MKILLFNGPPGSGKDYISNVLCNIKPDISAISLSHILIHYSKTVWRGFFPFQVVSQDNYCIPKDYNKVKDIKYTRKQLLPAESYASYKEALPNLKEISFRDFMLHAYEDTTFKKVFGHSKRLVLKTYLGSSIKKAQLESKKIFIIRDIGYLDELNWIYAFLKNKGHEIRFISIRSNDSKFGDSSDTRVNLSRESFNLGIPTFCYTNNKKDHLCAYMILNDHYE